jgi:tRNA-2-methylthio-N6-dimethylallyladenosine synthase
MKYHIITFGCQMNKADSERIAAKLGKKGYKPAESMADADLVLVNMCSIRQPAVDRVYGVAEKLKELKLKNKRLKTVLTGCILRKDSNKLKRLFDSVQGKEGILSCFPKYKAEGSALIPISNGCNNFCSYCVVPYVRGRLLCRSHKDILKEAKRAIKDGVKEVWLLGQNVNDYKSPANSKIDFSGLFKEMDGISGDFKIFFMSPHPKNFSDKLIKTLTGSKHFSRYLNLPVQSGDDEILKKMNRSYTVKQYLDLVKELRKGMPDINLSTDVIVGFPGETKSQFKNTEKLFRKIKFNMAYINKYSPRTGTASFKMKNDVTLQEKKKREKILMDIIYNHE